MSGAVAAHAAYNGAGTQGLAVTNKLNDAGDVTSVFWNKNDTTRQLLHGSSYVEVVSSGSSGRVNNFGSSRIFTVNNDIDLLSDIYLDINFSVDISDGATGTGTNATTSKLRLFDFEMKPTFSYQIIDRVEFMVGTQIWHTLTGDDIKVLNYTSKPPSANIEGAHSLSSQRYHNGTHSAGAGVVVDPSFTNGLPTVAGGSETVRAVVWIPALCSNMVNSIKSFSNVKENGYLMAAAPQQSVKIKLIFKTNTTPERLDASFAIPAHGGFTTTPNTTYISGLTSSADGSGGVITASGIAFYGNLIGGASKAFANSRYPFKTVIMDFSASNAISATGAGAVTLRTTISSVRMFAKQIMLCKEERDQIRNIPNGIPYRIKMSQSVRSQLPTSGTEVTIDLDSFSLYASHLLISVDMSRNCMVRDMELKLNSSSFSGTLPFSMLINNMSEHLGIQTPPTIVSSHFNHVEKFMYLDGTEDLGEFYGELPMMVFPLASSAFSGSAVPLNRFDSIRLTIRFTGTPESGGTFGLSGKTSGITVTCVGETTVLYKGGAATLAMY